MHRIRFTLRWVGTFVAVMGIGRSVQAVDLPVDNAGFDRVPLAPGGYTYTLNNWVGGVDPTGALRSPWISNGYYGNQPTPVSEALVSQTANVFQELADTFQEGLTYTFTIDAGVSDVGSENWRLYIFDATATNYQAPLVVNVGSNPVDGVFYQLSVQYTATASESGHTIGIGVAGIDSGYYCYYDNAAVTEIDLGAAAPEITAHPQDREVIIGDPAAEATFTVGAIGSVPLSYQWYLNGSPISGGTNTSLTVSPVGAAEIGDYHAIVSNVHGSEASQTAALTLMTTDVEPAAQSVVFGDAATFSITLPGSGYTYQWMLDGGNIAGATSNVLDVAGTLVADAGDYTVAVSHAGATASSGAATLEVTLPEVDPAAQAALVTDTTAFRVSPAYPGYTYQWKKGGVNVGGATSNSLVLSGISAGDAADYTVNVSFGGETHLLGPGTLTVSDFPTQPYAALVNADNPIAYWRLGENVGAAQAIDSAADTYHGRIRSEVTMGNDGALIGDADSCASFPAGSSNSLIHVAEDYDAIPSWGWPALNPVVFSVECWAKVDGGSGTDRSPVTSRGWYAETDIEGWTLYATAEDVWEFRIGQGQVISGSAWNVISGPSVVQGAWTHLVGTYDGTDMKFYVDGALWGVVNDATFTKNYDAALFIGAGGTEDDTGAFYWNGAVDEVSLYDRALTGAEVLEHWAGAFQPGFPPKISGQPRDTERMVGEVAAAFDVGVRSTPVVTYQWQYGGVDLPGATDQVLIVPDIEAGVAGMYRVLISNSTHSVTSSAAELSICSGTCDMGVLNGGFDDADGVLASRWNNLGGGVRGGIEGGFGWTESYYTGGWRSGNDTFATTFGGPVRQDLTGPTMANGLTYGRTFVEGVTYTLDAKLFSSDTYGTSAGSTINWRIALTADGITLADDVWYSDEFVAAGEAVPPGRLIIVTNDTEVLTADATLVYTATATDAGKVIGVELGGDVTLGATTGDDYYGHMDTVVLTAREAVDLPPLTIDLAGGDIVVTWGGGSLQESDDLTIPSNWTDVVGAVSPYTITPVKPVNAYRAAQ